MIRHFTKKDVMLSPVEVWWVGLYTLPFDGAQGDTLYENLMYLLKIISWSICSVGATRL